LAKLGHDVHVFAGSTENGGSESEHDGVRVTRYKREGWLDRMLDPLRRTQSWWAANRIQAAYHSHHMLAKALQQEKLDVVEFPECGADGMVVSTLCDVPSVVKFHSPARLIMEMYQVPRLDRELTAFIEQIAIKQATARTSCSQFLADEVTVKLPVHEHIDVVRNGIDLDLFDRDDGIDVGERFNLQPGGTKVFFANRLEERKGVHLLKEMCFEVMAKYPNAHFVIAGNDLFGYMEREILPFIKENGLEDRFHYLGQLTLPEVRAVLKHIDIFLIPSLWENCPYSCIEAMSAGRAIVSSDCGGMPELIEHDDRGLLARNDDAPAFVAALERMLDDTDLRARTGASARRFVEENLTDVEIARRSLEVYERIAR
jgi:glycosyltransferase involved in cell wall biosynthesis